MCLCIYMHIYIYIYIYIYTVVFQALSHVWLFMMQRTRLPCPQLSPRICSYSCPLSQWCYLTISSSSTPFPFAFNHSQYQGLFQWVGCMHQVAKVLELHLQHQTLQWKFRVLYIYIYMKVKVTQSCLTLWEPMDYTVHGIIHAYIYIYIDR